MYTLESNGVQDLVVKVLFILTVENCHFVGWNKRKKEDVKRKDNLLNVKIFVHNFHGCFVCGNLYLYS